MSAGTQVYFSLNLSSQQYLAYYQGVVQAVQVIAEDGRTIRFPAHLLRRFLTHTGIQGRFCLRYDATSNRLEEIQRIDNAP